VRDRVRGRAFSFLGGNVEVNRDGEIVTFLALDFSPQEVARRIGISASWVYRRLKDKEFAAMVDAVRDEYGDTPADLKRLYAILADLRAGLHFIDGLDSTGAELTAIEARKHLSSAERWVEEWCWLKEQDLDSSAVNLVSEVYEHQTHGDTCTCVLGEAAA
jgi:AcrR family transcriptional regulator